MLTEKLQVSLDVEKIFRGIPMLNSFKDGIPSHHLRPTGLCQLWASVQVIPEVDSV